MFLYTMKFFLCCPQNAKKCKEEIPTTKIYKVKQFYKARDKEATTIIIA